MQTRNRLKAGTHFKVSFWVCFGPGIVQCNDSSNLKLHTSKDAYSELGHSPGLFKYWGQWNTAKNNQGLITRPMRRGTRDKIKARRDVKIKPEKQDMTTFLSISSLPPVLNSPAILGSLKLDLFIPLNDNSNTPVLWRCSQHQTAGATRPQPGEWSLFLLLILTVGID